MPLPPAGALHPEMEEAACIPCRDFMRSLA